MVGEVLPDQVMVIAVPQLGVNDDTATVVQWYVKDGESVSAGQNICELETSKASFDVESETNGCVVHLVDAGAEVSIKQAIALMGPEIDDLRTAQGQYRVAPGVGPSGNGPTSGSSPSATKKAVETASRLGVDLAEIPADGIVREQDVLRHYGAATQEESVIDLTWDSGTQPVVIYGAGLGAVTIKECLDLDPTYSAACFVDDNPEHPSTLSGLPVYHGSRLEEIAGKGVSGLACAIAKAEVRLRILDQCERLGIELMNVVHPRAYISPSAKIGRGNHIKSGAIIETNSVIGDCCIIDNGALIPHNNVIGDGCHVAPGAILGSGVNVGAGTIIGIGVSISTGITIGKGVILAVGAAVTQDVPDNVVMAGVPAKVVGKATISVGSGRD